MCWLVSNRQLYTRVSHRLRLKFYDICLKKKKKIKNFPILNIYYFFLTVIRYRLNDSNGSRSKSLLSLIPSDIGVGRQILVEKSYGYDDRRRVKNNFYISRDILTSWKVNSACVLFNLHLTTKLRANIEFSIISRVELILTR